MAAQLSLGAIVDLERYPIDDLGSARGRALVERCRAELDEFGACDLEGFLHPAAVDPVVAWGIEEAPNAFRKTVEHTVYFDRPDPELVLSEDDPRRARVRSAKGGLAYDLMPADLPLRVLYESDELTEFVGSALGLDEVYRHADPLGALNVMLYEPGDELGWHFDNAHFVVTLMLQPPRSGGDFEYVPMLRSADDPNYDGVAALLAGSRDGVRGMSGTSGTLALFRGHYSPHRVTPVTGDRPRVNAVLAYSTESDARLSRATRELFYGRTDSPRAGRQRPGSCSTARPTVPSRIRCASASARAKRRSCMPKCFGQSPMLTS